jgi:hypothetical protein
VLVGAVGVVSVFVVGWAVVAGVAVVIGGM